MTERAAGTFPAVNAEKRSTKMTRLETSPDVAYRLAIRTFPTSQDLDAVIQYFGSWDYFGRKPKCRFNPVQRRLADKVIGKANAWAARHAT